MIMLSLPLTKGFVFLVMAVSCMCVFVNAFALLCLNYGNDNRRNGVQEKLYSNICPYSLYGFCEEKLR